MVSIIFFAIISLSWASSDTIVLKGGKGISYRTFVAKGDFCFQYKMDRIWSESIILDKSDVSEFSIAITPGDYIHVVWCKEGKVYYKTTLQPVTPSQIRRGQQPVWSEKVPISTPTQPITEPASNPFIEAQGEWVYAVWRGPNEEGNPDFGEIWQKRRRLDRPYYDWKPPENKSLSPLRESNYPTMSTGIATVWQEFAPGNPDNYEIYANLLTEFGWRTVNISNTPTNSFFPHCEELFAFLLLRATVSRSVIARSVATK